MFRLRSLFVALLLSLLVAAPVAANGIGDLYVGSPTGVDEFYLSGESMVNQVAIDEPAIGLAFSDDGRTLFASTGSAALSKIDIETLTISGTLRLPGEATLLAAPKGQRIAALLPARQSVAVADIAVGHIEEIELAFTPDLLAAHREQARFAVARAGTATVAIISATGAVSTVTVDGPVAAMAIDGVAGLLLVATTGPNRLTAYALDTRAKVEQESLAAAPTAVAASAEGAIVATGASLRRYGAIGGESGGGSDESWVAAGTIAEMAASKSGKVLFARHGNSVTAFDLDGREIGTVTGEAISVIAPIVGPVSVGPGAVDNGKDTLPATATELPTLYGALLAIALIALVALLAARRARA